MFFLRRIGFAIATVAIVLNAPSQSFAQEPPAIIKIMVGSAPGGILDPYARIVGEHMSKTLGRTIIVENKPGANGTIAAQFVVDQPADGTWMWVGTQAMTEINPSAYRNLRWGIDDFIPIVKGVEAPLVFAVHPSVPARTLNEWIAWVKANPGKLGYASFSPGTPSAFLGHQLNKRFGLDLAHIVYKGSGPQTQDIVAGHALMGFMQVGNAIPHIKAGKLIPIAVTSPKRSRFLPDVPTFAELGHDEFTAMVWFGLLTRKGTPEPIVKAYIAAAEKAHSDRDVQQKFEVQGMEATGVTGPANLTADIKTQIERWRKIVDETGFKAD
ncbi:tripartite tricarboxylate transporter substrate binding protein [Pseudorhodoplanes sp.]|uniref:Bug family tripartite tricarboxylate transporter substrate binding protein n=1 Tax=Pseudorhodoplanes sp. TaxID=1934341 RepID=UPI002B950710|nr:tripartite tricarboxylate transporter substrate binding protein [Pseudorhodoplanes sp.]HWV54523.1 tripartite tricarboxylate transporter substrate binding protein [Pseudorhodoplanes sp.]